MSDTPVVRNLAVTDLPKVAEVHLRAFPQSALSRLGREAVRRYYEWQLTGPHECLAAGAFRDDELLGFIFAGVFRGALTGFVKKNRSFLIAQVLTHPWLIFNSIVLDRISLGLRVLKPIKARNGSKPVAAPQASATPYVRPFGVLAIAVDPNLQRGGIGRLLMEYAENVAKCRGFQVMSLTVQVLNEKAIMFYEKNGWFRVTQNGIWNGSMRKILLGSE